MTNENCLDGIRCPRGGHDDRFLIAARVVAEVTDDGAEPASSKSGNGFEWDDASDCRCPACDRYGPLREFRIPQTRLPDPEGVNDRRAGWTDRNNFDFAAALDRAEFPSDAETTACPDPDSVMGFPTSNDGVNP